MNDDDKTDPQGGMSSDIDEEASHSDTKERATPETMVTEEETTPISAENTSNESASQTEALLDETPTDILETAPEDGEESTQDIPGVPRDVLLSRMESVLFASPEPMSVRRLANILGVDGKESRSLASELVTFYQERGIILEEISKGFQFRTHPKNAAVIREVFKLKPLKISKAALETLAIVAYRQPLTRAETEQIRGVDCGGVLKYLFEKELVRVIGRKEEPGRPIIYGTTNAFLELFGLKSLSDLPALHEFSELWEENQRIVDEEMPSLEESDAQSKSAPRPPTTKTKQKPAEGSENEATLQNGDASKSGVENPEEIGDESGNSTENKGDSHMGDNKNPEQAQKDPADPAKVPTEVIDESEMADILASIEAPSPIPNEEDSEEEEADDDDNEKDSEKVDKDD